MKPFSELPHSYLIALEQVAKQYQKPSIDILKEMIDFWLEKNHNAYSQNTTSPTTTNTEYLPIYSSQLEIIPTGNKVGLLLQHDNGYLLENTPYPNFESALLQLKEYEAGGRIDLQKWTTLSGEYPSVFLQKIGGLAHIWLGQNSACKILNNQEVKTKGFTLSKILPKQRMCKVCVSKYKALKVSKFQLSFDAQNTPSTLYSKLIEPLF